MPERAWDEGWDYEAYLAAVLAEEVSARDSHGGSGPVSRPPGSRRTKTLDDFDFTVQTSVSRQTIAHLAQLDFLAEAQNVVFLGPPGTGKTHLSIALGVQAARRGQRVAFATAHQWVNRLGAAKLSRAGSTTSSSGSAGSRCSTPTRSAVRHEAPFHRVGSEAHPRPPQRPGEAGGSPTPEVGSLGGSSPDNVGTGPPPAGRARKRGRQA